MNRFNKKVYGLFLLAFVLYGFNYRITAQKIPAGKAILPDGKCAAGEWRDAAAAVDAGGGFKLRFKRAGEFVFFCLEPPREQVFTVDFYLSPETQKLYTFHVSAKLGERRLETARWKDWTTDWNWWQTSGWTANALRPDDFEKRVFFPQKAIEFQISREFYAGKKWRVMLDISGSSVIFPAEADNLKPESWLELRF
jgi:hypothetical protein